MSGSHMYVHRAMDLAIDVVKLGDYSQMSNFVGSHDDAAEAAGVLDDGHAVHLLQSLVHHACAADVSEAFSETKHTTEMRQLVGCLTQLHFLLLVFIVIYFFVRFCPTGS